jgi:hypothetical protein
VIDVQIRCESPQIQKQGRLSRTEVRFVYCPACKAQPGSRCKGKRKKVRESNHRERVQLAERTLG